MITGALSDLERPFFSQDDAAWHLQHRFRVGLVQDPEHLLGRILIGHSQRRYPKFALGKERRLASPTTRNGLTPLA